MYRTLSAALISSGLLLTGWYSLFSIRDHGKKRPALNMVLDYGPYCDEASYLDSGLSLETASKKKVEATEDDQEIAFFKVDEKYHTIDDGQTLHSILRPKNVSEQEIANLGASLKPYLLARDLASGDLYKFSLVHSADGQNNLVTEFVIRKLDPNRVPVLYRAIRTHKNADDAKFSVELRQPKIEEKLALIDLTVNGTLYQTFSHLPYGSELMRRLMDVFLWQIRMPTGVINGDKLEILVVQKYTLGEFIGYGKIKSVYYKQKARTYFATFFASKDNKIRGIFDENGKSLEKEFANSPVDDTTATSDQKWRMHPIRKIRIRHNGIDYRGTVGTEFFSIADGEVIEKRYDRNVGNMIRIKHKYGVHSEYFHANSLEDNLAVGMRVKRGQKLGTIGRTGRLCTGPHLHMGLYRLQGEKRKFIEMASLSKTLRPAVNLPQSYTTEFNDHVRTLTAMMSKEKAIVMESPRDGKSAQNGE